MDTKFKRKLLCHDQNGEPVWSVTRTELTMFIIISVCSLATLVWIVYGVVKFNK